MHSVTSEAVISVSFQAAPPKPARSDQSSGNDHFGTLIDSSIPADTGNDRATSTAQQQPSASQRRSDDASATAADHARPRDATAADQAAQKNSDDRDATAKRLSDTNADSNADADAVQRSTAKSSGLKAGVLKAGALQSAEKSSSEQTSAADAATVAALSSQQGEPSVTTPNAVAVVIPVPVALVDIPAAAPAAGNATAPLAIAAAAIAASSSATSGSAAASAQIKVDAGAAADAGAAVDAIASATAIGSAAATPIASDAATTANIAVQAAATAAAAAPVKQRAAQAVATAVTDVALATAVAATAPVVPKTTPLKAPVAAPTKTAASVASDIAPGTPDPPASAAPAEAAHDNVAPQPAVAARPETRNGEADAVKADTSAASPSTSAATAAPQEHSPVIAMAHALTDTSNAGVQATGTIQPQLPAVAATAALAGPLSVTPATTAAVPWSGLALEIAVSARSGKSRFDIRLDPADLGRIDVRIDVDRNGQVTSHLTVEKPETLSMLRQDAPQLQRQLDDAGFKTGNGGLQFSLRDQSSSGQNNGNETGRNAQRLIISDEDAIPAAVAGRTYGRMLGSSSGVDIRV